MILSDITKDEYIEIHIKIHEGKNLWEFTKRGQQASVHLHLKDKKNKVQTNLSCKQTNPDPKWFEEFKLFVFEKTNPIILEVLNEKESLGQTSIDITNFEPSVINEMWLPLEESKSNGEIHVSIVVYSKTGSAKFLDHEWAKIPNFRFSLKRYTYYPGEKIHAVLYLNLSYPIPIQTINIKIYGVETVHTQNRRDGETHRKFFFFFDESISISGAGAQIIPDEGTEILQPAFHSFQLEYTLPWSIPPSFSYLSGCSLKTKYKLRGTLDMGKERIWISHPLTVDLDWPSQRMEDIEVKNEGKECVDIFVNVSPNPLIIGKPCELEVSVENHSVYKVSSVNASIRQRFTIHSESGPPVLSEKLLSKLKLQEEVYFPISQGEKKTMHIEIPVTGKILPNLSMMNSPLLQVEHFIKVKAILNSGTGLANVVGVKKVSHMFPVHIIKPVHQRLLGITPPVRPLACDTISCVTHISPTEQMILLEEPGDVPLVNEVEGNRQDVSPPIRRKSFSKKSPLQLRKQKNQSGTEFQNSPPNQETALLGNPGASQSDSDGSPSFPRANDRRESSAECSPSNSPNRHRKVKRSKTSRTSGKNSGSTRNTRRNSKNSGNSEVQERKADGSISPFMSRVRGLLVPISKPKTSDEDLETQT